MKEGLDESIGQKSKELTFKKSIENYSLDLVGKYPRPLVKC